PPRGGGGLRGGGGAAPPVELEVIVAGGPAGAKDGDPSPPARTAVACRPLEIRPLTQGEAVRRLRIQGRVKVASGPWGLEEGWWVESPSRRDYWDVELNGGGIYRIYRDRTSDSWVADRIYD